MHIWGPWRLLSINPSAYQRFKFRNRRYARCLSSKLHTVKWPCRRHANENNLPTDDASRGRRRDFIMVALLSDGDDGGGEKWKGKVGGPRGACLNPAHFNVHVFLAVNRKSLLELKQKRNRYIPISSKLYGMCRKFWRAICALSALPLHLWFHLMAFVLLGEAPSH